VGRRYRKNKPLLPEKLPALNKLFSQPSPLNIAPCGGSAGENPSLHRRILANSSLQADRWPRQLLHALPSTAGSRRSLPPTSLWAYLLHPCSRLDDHWVFDSGNDLHRPAAVTTRIDVDLEDTLA